MHPLIDSAAIANRALDGSSFALLANVTPRLDWTTR
jgi:hypothetical protein